MVCFFSFHFVLFLFCFALYSIMLVFNCCCLMKHLDISIGTCSNLPSIATIMSIVLNTVGNLFYKWDNIFSLLHSLLYKKCLTLFNMSFILRTIQNSGRWLPTISSNPTYFVYKVNTVWRWAIQNNWMTTCIMYTNSSCRCRDTIFHITIRPWKLFYNKFLYFRWSLERTFLFDFDFIKFGM